MPHVINGIGTWYCGKRNLLVRRDACEFCGRVADLRSYDSTLYFVVFFLPIIPLKRVHVAEECSVCKKLRVSGARQWREAREKALRETIPPLRDRPTDPELARKAIAATVAFEDEPAFAEVAPIAAEIDEAATQSLLGSGYAFFGHNDLAELAFRQSLDLKDDDEVAMRLAVHLLRIARTDDAWVVVQPLLSAAHPERAGLACMTVLSYQSQGKHEAALGVLDHSVRVYPALSEDKELRKLRKTSERHRTSGKRIKKASMEAGATKHAERRFISRVPGIFAALVLLAIVGGFLASSWRMGAARTVHLVSGIGQDSTVTIDGTDYPLQPFARRPIKLAEGSHRVHVTIDGVPGDASTFQFSSSFLTRPFTSRTYVVNADRLALIQWEQAVYTPKPSANAAAQSSMKLDTGEAFYEFSGIDYPFGQFPSSISTQKSSGTMKKERIDHAQWIAPSDAWIAVDAEIGNTAAKEWLRRAAAATPRSSEVFYILTAVFSADESLAVLKPLLERRPVLVEPHRSYQSIMEQIHPEHDLEAEYRALLAATPDDPALVYLVGRVVPDVAEAEALYRRAATGPVPVPRAHVAIAYQRAGRGQFDDALGSVRSALALTPEDTTIQMFEGELLVAAGRYGEVLTRREYTLGAPNTVPAAAMERALLLTVAGRRAEATRWIEEYAVELVQSEQPDLVVAWRRGADASMAYALGDPLPLAQLTDPAVPDRALDPDLAEALGIENLLVVSAVTACRFELLEPAGDGEEAVLSWELHLLTSIAAELTGNREVAEVHRTAAIKALAKGPTEHRTAARWLESTEPPDVQTVLSASIMPSEKCVILTALGIRHRDIRAPLFELAGRLNYQLSFPRVLIRSALEKTDWP